jgi:hypothetical protein
LTVAILAVAVLGAGGVWWSRWRPAVARPDATTVPVAAMAEAPSPPAVPVTVAATEPPAAAVAPPGFAKLKGRWQRPDGGYLLDLQGVAADGKLEAGYFNPRPIHVAKAAAAREGATLKVFVELRDVNYPGSTYTLAYDPAQDRLTGSYFQAALGQTFDVFFQRVTP